MANNSNFNLQTLNTREYADNVAATINFGGTLIAIGKRGSAKTAVIRDTIRNLGYKEIYLNLSTFERVDLGGYPNFFAGNDEKSAGQKAKYIEYNFPYFYKHLMEGDKPAVVLFDEADKVDHSVLAPLYEFTQLKTINGNPMPTLQAIMMTGNLPTEGGNRFPLPLLDRAEKYLIEIKPLHWLEWGAKTGEIHPSISAYINEHMDDLNGEVDPGEAYADQSARGWHNSSKILFFGEKNNWHPNMMLHKVAGCVGNKLGIKYTSFFEHYRFLLPVADKIIKGEPAKEFKDFEQSKKMMTCMILCHRFARLLDGVLDKKGKDNFKLEKDEQIISDNIAKFLGKVDPEQALIAWRGQIGQQRSLDCNLIKDQHWDNLLESFLKRVN